MRERGLDLREVVFERANQRLGLSGRRLVVARLYFLGLPLKAICRQARVPEGTMRGDLRVLHALLGTGSRAEFIHRVYELGGKDGRSRRQPRRGGGAP